MKITQMIRINGAGSKRPQLNVPVERLELDPLNPRLPSEYQGKNQNELVYALHRLFELEEIALSLAENGYFDEEPLVAIPSALPKQLAEMSSDEIEKSQEYTDYINNPNTKFIVVEGNRRLSTIKLLLDKGLRIEAKIKAQFNYDLKPGVLEDISILPVIIYPKRKDVLPYLGVRHITGIKKWDSYAKASYIASMVASGNTMEQVQEIVADKKNSARKFYLCYKIVQQAQDQLEIDTKQAIDNFSYLLLATGNNPYKDFLGLPYSLKEVDFNNQIVPKEKLENLANLFSWLYGDEKNDKVIKESRDITNKLAHVLGNEEAIKYLNDNRDLDGAFDRSGGEERLVETYLGRANMNLEKSLQNLHRHKDSDPVKKEINRLKENIEVITKISS